MLFKAQFVALQWCRKYVNLCTWWTNVVALATSLVNIVTKLTN